VEFSATELYIK